MYHFETEKGIAKVLMIFCYIKCMKNSETVQIILHKKIYMHSK